VNASPRMQILCFCSRRGVSIKDLRLSFLWR
jgi:hypothetical protein